MIAFAVFGPIAAIAITGYAVTWRLCEPDRGRHVRPQPLPSRRRRVIRWLGRRWRTWRHGQLAAPAVLVRLREARYQLAWAHSSPVRPGTLPAIPAQRLHDEDADTVVWLRTISYDLSLLARARATSWTLTALTNALRKAVAADRWPWLQPGHGFSDDTGSFTAITGDGL